MNIRAKVCLLLCAVSVRTCNGGVYGNTNWVQVTSNLWFCVREDPSVHRLYSIGAHDMLNYMLTVPPELAATGTNYTYFRALPRTETFDFRLIDSSGNEVRKTRVGTANSKMAVVPKEPDEVFALKLQAVQGARRDLFRADEMFKITERGTYDLQVRIRICAPMSNGVPDLVAMSNLYQFGTNRHFGIVVSEPAHVKVLKE